MFKAIAYKNTIGPGPLIDIGALAEGLLFYERVVIVGNSGTVKDILRRIPPFILLSLMRDGRIEFHYLEDQIGVSSAPLSNGKSIYGLVSISSPDHTIEKVGQRAFKDAAGGTSQARIGGGQFSRLLRPIDHSSFDQESILQALVDKRFTQESVLSLVREVVPEFNLPNDSYFKVERAEKGFYVDTNLDFEALNAIYHRKVPPSHSSLTEAYFLALIQGAYEATTSLPSSMQRLRFIRLKGRFRQNLLKQSRSAIQTVNNKSTASLNLHCRVLTLFERQSIQVLCHSRLLSSS